MGQKRSHTEPFKVCLALVVGLALGSVPSISRANGLVFKEWSITHPRLTNPPTPLVVQQRYRFDHSPADEIERHKYWPLMYEIYSVQGDEEIPAELGAARYEIYDAFPSFDRSTVILIRRLRNEGFDFIQEIDPYDRCGRGVQDVKGAQPYWTKDGRYLVTVMYATPETGNQGGMYFYDLNQCRLVKEVPYTDHDRLRRAIEEELVPAESKEDVTWQVDLKGR